MMFRIICMRFCFLEFGVVVENALKALRERSDIASPLIKWVKR